MKEVTANSLVTKQQKIKTGRAKHQQRWFGKWHVYLGIIAGFVIAVVGVTGSLLVFQDDIDEALNPGLFRVVAQQSKMTIDEIVPVVKQKYPALRFNAVYNVSDKTNHAYRFYNYKTEEEFFVNPYTGNLSGKRIYESGFIHVVTEIHTSLLVPVVGRYIVGLSSLVLLILTITGLRLWVPKKWKQLKGLLTVNFKAGFKRQNYDWHNVVGVYTAPVVSLLALTGFCITFSILVIPTLFVISGKSPQGVAQLLGARSVYFDGARSVSTHQLDSIAKMAMPESRIAGIAFPDDSTGSYRLDMITGKMPRSGKREMLIIEQYSGKILLNSRTDFPNVGNAYLSWLTPIHYGSFGGLPTQLIALIGGLSPLILFITGFIIWYPRWQKQKKSALKKSLKRAAGRPLNVVENDAKPEGQPKLGFSRFGWKNFAVTFKKGNRYALWWLLITAAMGALYGVFSGIMVQPAVFAIAFTAVLVMLNFLVALLSFLFNVIFLMPFKKGSFGISQYFTLSLSFCLVFLVAYVLLMNTGAKFF